jgi:hypothetical protein
MKRAKKKIIGPWVQIRSNLDPVWCDKSKNDIIGKPMKDMMEDE